MKKNEQKEKHKQMKMNLTLHDENMSFWVDANKIYVEKLLQEICRTLADDFDMEEEVYVVIGENTYDEDEEDKEECKTDSLTDMTFSGMGLVNALLLMMKNKRKKNETE